MEKVLELSLCEFISNNFGNLYLMISLGLKCFFFCLLRFTSKVIDPFFRFGF